MPTPQGDLFENLSKAEDLTILNRLVRNQTRVARAEALKKKLESKIELDKLALLAKYSKGNYVVGNFSLEVTEANPACRPSWKDEFMKLAVTCKMDAEAAVLKVTERVKRTLVPVKKLTVKKVDEVR